MVTNVKPWCWRIVSICTLFLMTSVVHANISGKIFNDFNGNGTFDSGSGVTETGIAGVAVKAFDASGVQVGSTATSAADGSYTLTGLSSGKTYRVEFSWGNAWLKEGVAGGTSVQFAANGATGVNAALSNPAQYCQVNPKVAVTRMIPDNLTTKPVVLSFDYNSSGENRSTLTALARGSDRLGTTWGAAYRRETQKLYVTSVLRRHASEGSLGFGGIYELDATNPTAAPVKWLTIANAGSLSSARGIPVGGGPSHDTEAYQQAGKISLGDIDISEDGKTLYVMNLNTRSLLPIDIDSKTVGAAIPVGNPGCSSASDARPWAIKVQNGEVYVGAVCSEESVGSITSKFKAYVMKLSGGSFTTVASMPLNYEKDLSIMGTYANKLACGAYHGWFPWTSNTSLFSSYAGCRSDEPKLTSHPQPILSDIEFDVDGSIILGFLDRFALQSGGEDYAPSTSDSATYTGVSGGDIRRICNVNGAYVVEGGTGCAFNGGQDYSKKNEFYVGDHILYAWMGTSPAESAHSETAMGGLALQPGGGAVLTNVFDPIDDLSGSGNRWGTGGVRWLNNTTGASQKGFEIISFSDRDFVKSASLGDLELMCGPAPLEIGNRVWLDANQNGVQDADESGLANVSVQLLSGATVLATAVTASDGSYYFSNATGPSSGSRKYGVTQLQPGNAYKLKFPASVMVGGNVYSLTTTAAGANPQIDSNAGALGEVNVAASDIAVTGANNHSFDVGYTLVPEGCNLEGGGDGVASNNALGSTIVCAPTETDLKLSKMVAPGTAQRGATVTYTLTLTNESELDATGVVVTDKLPVGVTYVTYATAAGAYEPGTGVWTVGAVAAGQSVTLTITVTVD